jgi:hypothetical protein
MGTYIKLPIPEYSYDVTESEHYDQLSDTLQTIIKDLDGYLTSDSNTNADGYVAFFTNSTNLEGDNDLYWNRETNRLEVKGQGIYNPDGPVVLGTNATTSHSLGTGDVLVGGSLEVDGPFLYVDGRLVVTDYGGVSLIASNLFIHGSSYISPSNQYVFGLHSDQDRTMVITDQANYGKNHGITLADQATIKLFANRDPTEDSTRWLGLWHEEQRGVISTGYGELDFRPGENTQLKVADGYASFKGDVYVESGQKLYLDGGDDTYIQEVSPNTLKLSGGGSNFYISNSTITSYLDYDSFNKRIHDSSGALNLGASATPSVISDSAGNVVCGAELEVDGYAQFVAPIATPATSKTLGPGDSSFAAESSVMLITGDGSGNTISAIYGGHSGMWLTLIFQDSNVTLNDTAYGSLGANQMALNNPLSSASGTVLQLVHDGTGWVEKSRSANG